MYTGFGISIVMSFLPLKDLLPRAVRTAGIGDQVQAARALETARRVMAEFLPPEAMAGVQPLRLQHGTLTVQVPSSAVAQELSLRQGELLRRLNLRDPLRVERLRFRPLGEGADFRELG